MEFEKKAYSVQNVARILSVAEKTVYRWIAIGEIPALKVGKRFMIFANDLESWLNSKRSETAQHIP
jgi:excisionase family DNA binding protein